MTENKTTAELLARLDGLYSAPERYVFHHNLWSVAIQDAYPRLRAIIREQQERIEALEAERIERIVAMEKSIEGLYKARFEQAAELAASQAREAELREALEENADCCAGCERQYPRKCNPHTVLAAQPAPVDCDCWSDEKCTCQPAPVAPEVQP